MLPKGKLIIIGGHEDKGEVLGENLTVHRKNKAQTHFEILGELISKIPRAHHVIEIIATASHIEKEMEDLYIASFKSEGFTKVGIIKVNDEEDGNNLNSIKRVQSAHAVFFTGGDQVKLISFLQNTGLLESIKKKYFSDKNFIVGGTSAGAMVLPEIAICGGVIREALFTGDIKISKGFDLIQNIIVDTHFIKRGRFARLAHAVALNPTCLGIGLEENTALIVSGGRKAECIGSGMIVLIDGQKIRKTNINSAAENVPIVAEDFKVSILAKGSKFSLKVK